MKVTATTVLTVAALLATPVTAQERQLVQANGTTVAYRDIGAGEPLLLLHGFSGAGEMWDPVVSDLGSRYRLIVPDLRGHGQSSNPLAYFTHADAAADILGLLDVLGIAQARAVGFSSGGMVLLHMGTSQPDRLSHIALVGSTPYLPESARDILRSMDPDVIPMAELDAMELVHRDTTQARLLLRQFVDFQDSYDDVNFTPPLLSTITASTLVIHGDRDPFFSVDIPVAVYGAIPDSYLLVFPNLGHAPFPEDEGGRRYYVDVLLRFLGDAW